MAIPQLTLVSYTATSHYLRAKHRTTPKASTLIANTIELSG